MGWENHRQKMTCRAKKNGRQSEKRPAIAIILGPLNGAPAQSDAKAQYDDWTRRPNEDAEADARLARQTKICKGC